MSSLILIAIISWEIYIYTAIYKIKWMDFRLWILAVSCISSMYTFEHYAIDKPAFRSKTFFMIEMFRFVIFFMICYYYCDKAGSLLSNKGVIKLLLRIMFVAGFTLNISLGLYILEQINNFNAISKTGINPRNLCANVYF